LIMVKLRRVALTALVILTIPGGFPCRAAMPTTNAEYGPSPELVAPTKSILPTIRVAKAEGWNDDAKPQSAEGTTVTAYARKLQHPRWLYVLPNGDVLVAESEAPAKRMTVRGVSGKVHKLVMKRAGSGAHPNANSNYAVARIETGIGRDACISFKA